MASNKVIITCAVTGAIHTPSMSPHLPVTPDEMIRASGVRPRFSASASLIRINEAAPSDIDDDDAAQPRVDHLHQVPILQFLRGGFERLGMDLLGAHCERDRLYCRLASVR